MSKKPESPEAGASAQTAFLAMGVIAAIAILAVMAAALSGPENAPPAGVPQGNDASPTPATGRDNGTSAMDVTPTPTPEPRRLRIVVGEGVDPTPAPTGSPDGGMHFEHESDKTPLHIAYAFQPNVTGIAEFTARWIVPQPPRYDGGPKHTIFLWTGIQQGSSGLIQAVLEWDHDNTGKYWTLACWAVDARDQSHDVSQRIHVTPGDQIKAELRYETDLANPWRKVWHIVMTDETQGKCTELIDDKGAVGTNRDVIIFSGVLEGIGEVSGGDDLPGDVMFRDIMYKDEQGNDMPIYLIGSVNDRFGRVAVEYEDGPAGSPVIIRTNYSV